MTLCIILLLTAFCAAITAEASMAYRLTATKENKDMVTLISESGIEKGLTALRQKIKATPSIFTDPTSLTVSNSDDFSFNDNNINCQIKFYDGNIKDKDNKDVPVIKIESTAKGKKSSKTITDTILKNDISNDYYNMLFNNAITVLDDVRGNNNTSFYFKNYLPASDKCDTSFRGNVYIQGGNMTFNPDKIYKSNDPSHPYASNINLFLNSEKSPVLNSTLSIPKENKVTREFSILPIKEFSTDSTVLSNFFDVDGITRYYTNQPTSEDAGYQKSAILKIIQNYDVRVCKQTTQKDGHDVTTLVTFKIVKKSSPSNPIGKDATGKDYSSLSLPSAVGLSAGDKGFDWSAFTNDVKDYIMRNMIAVYSTSDDTIPGKIKSVKSAYGSGYYDFYDGPFVPGDGNYNVKAYIPCYYWIDNDGSHKNTLDSSRIKYWVDNSFFPKRHYPAEGIPSDLSNVAYWVDNSYNYYEIHETYTNIKCDFETAFKGMYKLYLIDGDMSISTTPYMSYFINHIMYCTGKAYFQKSTLKGYSSARTHVSLINCSLLAKQVDINLSDYYDNISGSTTLWAYALEWDGIKSLESSDNPDYSPFSTGNRAVINRFLMEHLKGYENAIRFKIYKVEESN